MLSRSNQNICLLITDQSMKAALLSAGGTVERLASRDISGVSPEQLPKMVRTLLAGFPVRQAEVLCLIPAAYVTTKNIEVPSVDPEEIQSIVNLQAGRHTPFSREEILLGYINLGSYQSNYTKVLLAIVNRNIVKDKLSILEKADLRAARVAFVPEGIARYYAKLLNVKKDSSPVGIIDIGQYGTNFIIESRGTVVTCRWISIGFSQLKNSPEERNKLLEEIAKSIEIYRSEEIDKNPAQYLVTTDLPVVKEMVPLLSEALKAEVKISPAVDALKNTALLKKKFAKEFNEESFVDVFALVLAAKTEIDFMPEEIQMKRSVEEQGREVTRTGMFAVSALVLAGAILFSKIYFQDVFLNKNLRDHYAEQRQEVKQLEDLSVKNRIIKDYLDSRLVSLETIRELYRIIPNEIYLQNVTMDDEGTITIDGVSVSMSRVFAVVSSLEESELFKGVKTKSTATKKDRGKDVASFEIVFRLESAPDEEDLVAKGTDSQKAEKTVKE